MTVSNRRATVVMKNGDVREYREIISVKATKEGFVDVLFEDAEGHLITETINKDIVAYYTQTITYKENDSDEKDICYDPDHNAFLDWLRG